jgi:pyridoxine 5-phosphate synthase
MATLSVNIDHVATLRQARGGSEPDPVAAAALAEMAGAEGIIAHLREDRRHIQDRDVHLIKQTIKTRLNLEMAATDEMIAIARDVKPYMATLVPEKRLELTTEGGLDAAGQKDAISQAVEQLHDKQILVSLFIDARIEQIEAAKTVGADFVEIHTGHYADAKTEHQAQDLFSGIVEAVKQSRRLGLRVNLGHGLNYFNIRRYAGVGGVEDYSIGHAIMARAILVGLDRAVRDMASLVHAL